MRRGAASYADCHHEVRPVKQGYRVVLTWNLVARGSGPVADLPAQDIAALAEAVRHFWHTPVAPCWTGDTDTEPPDRLVYLLDHQYTQSGLSWDRLKSADAPRAAALKRPNVVEAPQLTTLAIAATFALQILAEERASGGCHR